MKTRIRSSFKELCILVGLTLAALLCVQTLKTEPAPQGRWLADGENTYYQDERGNRLSGWQEIDGGQYYFGSGGILTTGWLELNGEKYYFGTDGALKTGWQDIDGKRYYFSPGGRAVSGWQGIDGNRCYFHEDHSLAVGLTQIDEKYYLFSAEGNAFTGFVRLGDAAYLFQSDGTMAVGWSEYQGNRYFARENGTLYTGWMEEGGYRRYFHPDGVMAVGEAFVDGMQYYFTPEGYQITLVNPWHYLPAGYRVDLVAIDDVYAVDRACYEPLKKMLADCEAAGFEAIVCSAYRSQADQQWLYDRKVNFYLDEGEDLDSAREMAGWSVAVPGTSEHQLGLAVDIVSSDYYVLDDSQATTKTQQWLMAHCWEYGFILRYPDGTQDITGIIYEPWHYRYVGTEVSLALRDLGITLEEYLNAVQYD